MKRLISLSGKMVLTTFMLGLLFITLPAWSDFGEKPSIKEAAQKDNKTKLGRKDSENAVIDGSNKGGSTVKNKVVKKVGAAAAVGIVGKKVTSKIKK
jgi:hypothetical protein